MSFAMVVDIGQLSESVVSRVQRKLKYVAIQSQGVYHGYMMYEHEEVFYVMIFYYPFLQI